LNDIRVLQVQVGGVDAQTGGALRDPLHIRDIVNQARTEFEQTPTQSRNTLRNLSDLKAMPRYALDVSDLGSLAAGRWGIILSPTHTRCRSRFKWN
jgi:hypothetical protein